MYVSTKCIQHILSSLPWRWGYIGKVGYDSGRKEWPSIYWCSFLQMCIQRRRSSAACWLWDEAAGGPELPAGGSHGFHCSALIAVFTSKNSLGICIWRILKPLSAKGKSGQQDWWARQWETCRMAQATWNISLLTSLWMLSWFLWWRTEFFMLPYTEDKIWILAEIAQRTSR